MKSIKASVDTELITFEDSMNTYEVIKKLSAQESIICYLVRIILRIDYILVQLFISFVA